jgi:hypothetical protein
MMMPVSIALMNTHRALEPRKATASASIFRDMQRSKWVGMARRTQGRETARKRRGNGNGEGA